MTALLDKSPDIGALQTKAWSTHTSVPHFFPLLYHSSNTGLFAGGESDPQKQLCCSFFLGFPFCAYISPPPSFKDSTLEPGLFSSELPVSEPHFTTAAAEVVAAEDANVWERWGKTRSCPRPSGKKYQPRNPAQIAQAFEREKPSLQVYCFKTCISHVELRCLLSFRNILTKSFSSCENGVGTLLCNARV